MTAQTKKDNTPKARTEIPAPIPSLTPMGRALGSELEGGKSVSDDGALAAAVFVGLNCSAAWRVEVGVGCITCLIEVNRLVGAGVVEEIV